jgi:hypothetical protein
MNSAEVSRELALIEAALSKYNRETQRWADAYASEVISLVELKAYRAEIETRRWSLLARRTEIEAKLKAISQAVGQVEALIGYCSRVYRRLETFNNAEKRMAFEALDIRVRWIPGEPLTIEGSIPVGTIVAIPAPSR